MRKRISVITVLAALLFAGTALASAGEPKHVFTTAGQAVAKSVNLKLSDLPAGFKATPATSSSGGQLTCKGYNPDQSDLSIVGEGQSPDFNGPSSLPYLASKSDVFVSAAQAKTGYSRVVRPQVTNCLASLFLKAAPKGTKYVIGAAALKPVSGVGDQAALVRLTAHLIQGKQSIPFVIEVGFVNKGAVDAVMIVVNLGGPYPSTSALMAKLASRMP